MLKVQKVHHNAQIPKYADGFAACMDLFCPESFTIEPHGKATIKLGIKVQLPPFYSLKFRSRSGTSWKNSIEVGAGQIDENYRDELGVVLYNHSDVPYHFIAGSRVAQAFYERYEQADIVESEVESTSRGGFGSTGA